MNMNRREMLRLSAAVGASAALAACGTPGGTTEASAPSPEEVPDWLASLHDAARSANERTLTYYPTSPGQEQLLEKFRKTFPDIDLRYKYSLASELSATVDAEFASGQRTIDVLQGGPSLQLKLRAADRQEQWSPPADAGIPDSAVYFDGHMFAGGRLLLSAAYNTGKLQEPDVPETLDELVGGDWRDRIAMQLPTGAVAVDNALTTLYFGGMITEGTIAKLKGLPTENGNIALCTALAQGKYDAILWASSPSLFSVAAKGGPIKQAVQPRASVLQNDLVGILADPPHPNAARLFLGWFLSKAGQREIPGTGLYSIYNSLPGPDGFPDIGRVEARPLDPAKYAGQAAQMREITKKYWP